MAGVGGSGAAPQVCNHSAWIGIARDIASTQPARLGVFMTKSLGSRLARGSTERERCNIETHADKPPHDGAGIVRTPGIPVDNQGVRMKRPLFLLAALAAGTLVLADQPA